MLHCSTPAQPGISYLRATGSLLRKGKPLNWVWFLGGGERSRGEGRGGGLNILSCHSVAISQFPTVLGQHAFTKSPNFIRQPTGPSKGTCCANHRLLSPIGAALPGRHTWLLLHSPHPLCATESPLILPSSISLPKLALLPLPTEQVVPSPSPNQPGTAYSSFDSPLPVISQQNPHFPWLPVPSPGPRLLRICL